MDKDDEYRQYAAEAQALSDRAQNPADKQSWLRIAQSWMQLVKRPNEASASTARAQESAEKKFDAATEARDTHQKRSDESH